MVRTLKTSAGEMVKAARARITEVSAQDAVAMATRDDVLVVDLRDVRERERDGWIPGSFHCPRGMAEFWIDPESPYFKPVFGEDRTFLFHCASGWRSALTVATLQDMGLPKTAHITEGFKGWVEAGGATEKA